MSRERHLDTRLLNAIQRNFPGLDQRDMLLFLSAVGPRWLLGIPNLGWGSLQAALQILNENQMWNEDIANALRRHSSGDQFQLADGRWV